MTSEVYDELVIRTENGKKVFRVQAKKFPNWYGITDIGFIYHNELEDAELEYKGEVFNVHLVEGAMWDSYCDDIEIEPTEDGFKVFMRNHESEVHDMLNSLISERKEMKRT